jgi:hypothetical protein
VGRRTRLRSPRSRHSRQLPLTLLLPHCNSCPGENGALTAAEILEESELGALINKRAAEFVCPPGYGPDDAMKDSNEVVGPGPLARWIAVS